MKHTPHTLIAGAGLLAVLAMPAFAQESYAYLRPNNCVQDIKVPEGANGQYYLSKDCKTVFVLPRAKSPIMVNSFALGPTVNEFSCSRVFGQPKRLAEIEKQITRLETKLNKLYDMREERLLQNPEQEESINRTYQAMISAAEVVIAGYNTTLVQLEKGYPYSELEGAQMNFSMILDQGRDVRGYQEANKDSGLRFQAARIDSGTLSFAITGEDRAKSMRILDAKVPGINTSNDNRFEVSKHVLLNGGLAGGMTLSQHSVCNLVKGLNREVFNETLLTKESLLTAGFIANYTYDVPVTTAVTFKFNGIASADNIKAAFKGKLSQGEFTQEEVSDILYSGELMNLLTVEYGDGGIPTTVKGKYIKADPLLTKDEDNNVFNTLYTDAMDMYLKQVVDKMTSLGLIRESVKSNIDPVVGKELFKERVVRKCRWKTSWGRSKHVCKNETLRDRYFQEGNSTLDRTVTDNQPLITKVDLKAEETLIMKHTTGFGEE